MKSVLVGLMILAPFFAQAATLSFSGTVVNDAVAVDVFGADVNAGDSVTIEASIDLSTPLDSYAIQPGDLPEMPEASWIDFVAYFLTGRGMMDVEIGSTTFLCELGFVYVLNDYVFPPLVPDPIDGWLLVTESIFSCGDNLTLQVTLQGNDSDVLTNGDFFLPTSLDDYVATFEILHLLDGTLFEAANGTISAINVLSPAELIEDLAEIVQAVNLQAGISDALDRKLMAALSALEDTNENNDGAALNTMYAFCNNVDAQRGRSLTDAQADTLIDAANEVISALDEYAPLCQ